MINTSTLELFTEFDVFLDDTRQMEAFEKQVQLDKIKKILKKDRFTHCEECGLSYMPVGDFVDTCPECGGDV